MSNSVRKRLRGQMQRIWGTANELTGIPIPPKKPVRRRPWRGTWDDRLSKAARQNPFVQVFNWPTPNDVSRLLREQGNPYFAWWLQVDGTDGNLLGNLDHIPPAFADTDRIKQLLRMTTSPAIRNEASFVASFASHMCREYGVMFYGHAIPDGAALAAIAELDQPIIELGSGRGYWAWQLEQQGVRILAEEISADYGWFWRRPDRTSHRKLPRDHALFYCWPTCNDRWAFQRLREYQGNTVIYVGEQGGCTAEDAFHGLLEQRWQKTHDTKIPQWDGLHDRLTIWTRR